MLIRLLFALILVLPSVSHALVLLSEDFESGTLLSTGWTTDACTFIDPGNTPWANGCNPLRGQFGVAYSGTWSLKGTYTGKDSGVTISRNHTATTDLWMRLWYYTTGFTYDSTTTKAWFNTSTAAQGTQFIWGMKWGSREMSVEANAVADFCPNGNGPYAASCTYPVNMFSEPLTDDRWHCVEVHIKYNTPGEYTGQLEAWVNNKQTLGYYNVLFLGTSASDPRNGNSSSSVLDRFRYYVQSGVGTRYYDDLEIRTTRIGCGAAPPPPTVDTPPPSTPTGLAVN